MVYVLGGLTEEMLFQTPLSFYIENRNVKGKLFPKKKGSNKRFNLYTLTCF